MAPKRKATPTKKSAKTAGQRYTYTALNNVQVSSGTEHHVYGVIVDATFPYKVTKDRFICSLKIVDNTHNGKDHATVVIYAKRFEDLPIVHRVGDIIRLHRAALRIYSDKRQFNVNTQYYGSWALFSTDKNAPLSDCSGQRYGDNEPFAHNGKNYTFEKHEVGILGALRKWASSYFAGHDGVTKDMYCALNKLKAAKSGDADVVAKITQLHNFDEYTNELRLTDASGDCWFTLATKLKFPHLRAGQVVRVRSCTVDESSSKNMLSQSHFSNIMTFIGGSRLAANVGKSSANAKAEAASKNSNHAHVITEPAAKFANMGFTSLSDLFKDGRCSGTTFRVCLQVLAVQPGSVADMVKSCAGGKVSSAKGGKGNLIWHAQLLCKDASTANGSNQYKILNYSDGGHGANFFGKAQDLSSNAKAAKDVEGRVAELTKFNNWMDCVVEKVGAHYVIRDTKFCK